MPLLPSRSSNCRQQKSSAYQLWVCHLPGFASCVIGPIWLQYVAIGYDDKPQLFDNFDHLPKVMPFPILTQEYFLLPNAR
jgi:hypothetical protein